MHKLLLNLNQHKPTSTANNMNNKQKGFGMIELLVSIFVLAIGLLGLAGLQTNALQFNQDAYLRSVATEQIYDITDRMRANIAGVNAGNYNSITSTPSDPGCSTCTPAQVAQRDAFNWNTANTTLLPSGQGTVTGNNNIFTITIMWDSRRIGATGTGCSGDPNVDLTCLSANVRI